MSSDKTDQEEEGGVFGRPFCFMQVCLEEAAEVCTSGRLQERKDASLLSSPTLLILPLLLLFFFFLIFFSVFDFPCASRNIPLFLFSFSLSALSR